MARIQILELPTIYRDGEEETPFALVVDQAGPSLVAEDGLLRQGLQQNLREQLGARAVLIFEDTIEIPANEVGFDSEGNPIKLRVEADLTPFDAQVASATEAAKKRLGEAIEHVNTTPANRPS